MPTELRYEEHDHVGVITLDRPEARNALTHTTYAELEDAVRTTSARCLVITGTDPAFCSGDDVKQIMVGAGEAVASGLRRAPALTPAAEALLHTDVPIVAAVNGAAVGWGMELALMADIRVASERAKLGELFVHRGLCSDVPGIGRLAQLVGRERAAELLFTGRVVDADGGAGAGAGVPGRPARRAAADRPGARAGHRRQPAARRAAAEAGAAPRARPRLARARAPG